MALPEIPTIKPAIEPADMEFITLNLLAKKESGHASSTALSIHATLSCHTSVPEEATVWPKACASTGDLLQTLLCISLYNERPCLVSLRKSLPHVVRQSRHCRGCQGLVHIGAECIADGSKRHCHLSPTRLLLQPALPPTPPPPLPRQKALSNTR